jgi:hypothetical protein
VTGALLVLGFAWLLGLTVLVGALIRHMGALQIVAGFGSAPQGMSFNFDTDGPWIPSVLPGRAAAALERAGISTADLAVAFFSSSCMPCLERAEEIVREHPNPARTLFLVTGDHEEAVETMTQALAPVGAPILFDPDAHDIVKSLDIEATPFAFRIAAGEVVQKAYLRSARDFMQLASADLPERDGSDSLPGANGRARASSEKAYARRIP